MTFPVFLNSFSYLLKIEKCYSPALVGRYWEKLCPLSRVRPEAALETSGRKSHVFILNIVSSTCQQMYNKMNWSEIIIIIIIIVIVIVIIIIIIIIIIFIFIFIIFDSWE